MRAADSAEPVSLKRSRTSTGVVVVTGATASRRASAAAAPRRIAAQATSGCRPRAA
jgi:hypothetical protein